MAKDGGKIKLKIHFGKISAIMVALFAVLLTADLVLKYCEIAFNWNFIVIPKLIWVESGVKNFGAAGGMLATQGGKIFLIILTFVMLVAMIAAFLFLPERFVILKLALAMVASGALGNLVDRLTFGYVRDFVWMFLLVGDYCCNFADFFIVIGVIIALIDFLFINEWAIFPLSKAAKAARDKREENEKTMVDLATPAADEGEEVLKNDESDNSDGGEEQADKRDDEDSGE